MITTALAFAAVVLALFTLVSWIGMRARNREALVAQRRAQRRSAISRHPAGKGRNA